jgi:hypothetical protein
MSCAECSRLIADYDRLHLAYKAAFDFMIASSKMPGSDFSKLRIAADDARNHSEVARVDLEQHQRI